MAVVVGRSLVGANGFVRDLLGTQKKHKPRANVRIQKISKIYIHGT